MGWCVFARGPQRRIASLAVWLWATSLGCAARHGGEPVLTPARPGDVEALLAEAEVALNDSDYAVALGLALKARRVPLNLDEIDLVERIDAVTKQAARRADEKVGEFVARGQLLAAVMLARQMAEAGPDLVSQSAWATQAQADAPAHYSQAAAAAANELPGAAALALAAAAEAGAKVEPGAVQRLWRRFLDGVCFAPALARVSDASRQAALLVPVVDAGARGELERLRARCEGRQPLGLNIRIDALASQDSSRAVRVARPFADVEIKTTEAYVEEQPYTTLEQVEDVDVRKEKRELRDCAPRPGKERGCRTWVEEVAVSVPVVRVREVQRLRRVEKQRPLAVELSAEQGVMLDTTLLTRRLSCSGVIEVQGTPLPARPFAVSVEGSDTSNPAVQTERLVIAAHSATLPSVASLEAQAGGEVVQAVAIALDDALLATRTVVEQQAREFVHKDDLVRAEERYLALLMLGSGETPNVSAFFVQRYGLPLRALMDVLGAGLAKESQQTNHRATSSTER